MRLLIPGGAGYIGSHMVRYAQKHNHDVTVLDNFSTGHKWSINNCEILNVNLLDKDKLSKILKDRYFDGVIHFAAKSLVGESIKKPELYYENNVTGTLNLVTELLKNNVNNLVFSSTAAIFGNPIKSTIDENHPRNPINPYGKSKLMIEEMLYDISKTAELNVACLRYFNAAGADKSGEIGEAHHPETHLIPNVLNAAKSQEYVLKIFGNDYPTRDGTCIRDYIHVTDLASAHLLSLDYLLKHSGFYAFNLGNGNGFSVMEILNSCKDITNKDIKYEVVGRRIGDPAILVADNNLALEMLAWSPKYKNIKKIIESAWKWHSSKNI